MALNRSLFLPKPGTTAHFCYQGMWGPHLGEEFQVGQGPQPLDNTHALGWNGRRNHRFGPRSDRSREARGHREPQSSGAWSPSEMSDTRSVFDKATLWLRCSWIQAGRKARGLGARQRVRTGVGANMIVAAVTPQVTRVVWDRFPFFFQGCHADVF